MNIGLVIAGGTGQRMYLDIPKQFLNVYDKPVIIYTLEAFQAHPSIDAIAVSCLKGWEEVLRAYCRQYGITKLEIVTEGGATGQASIYSGLQAISERYAPSDIVLVHDSIRPMLSEEIISDCLRVCGLYGNAIATVPCNEAMLDVSKGNRSDTNTPRDRLRRTQTPQAFHLGELLLAHEEAMEKGITNAIACCTLMQELGRPVYCSAGAEKNLKLTTLEDIDIFKALLAAESG